MRQFHPGKMHCPIRVAEITLAFPCAARATGGQGTIGSLRRFFGDFSVTPQKYEPQAMDFWLVECMRRAARSSQGGLRQRVAHRGAFVGDGACDVPRGVYPSVIALRRCHLPLGKGGFGRGPHPPVWRTGSFFGAAKKIFSSFFPFVARSRAKKGPKQGVSRGYFCGKKEDEPCV